jgi:hypothetical protein
MRDKVRAFALLALAACGQAAHAGYAGLWFQCQPRWAAEKNYLLVDVKPGERAWSATWGASDSAQGRAQKDKDGNLQLRGCHALAGKPRNCNAAQPPLFATLPKGLADGQGPAADVALRRGGWIHSDRKAVEQLAGQCAALRPKGKG